MNIGGLNRLTLVDFPAQVACIVFFEGCNFRCPFCHNAVLVERNGQKISHEEFFLFLNRRKGVLTGVVLSGGEPLINDIFALKAFILPIKQLGLRVKLDTNGSFPDKLKLLLDEGLIDYVAMDIKNCPTSYQKTTNCPVDTKKIQQSLQIIKSSGVQYELRTTLVKQLHTDDDLKALGEWLKGEQSYFIQEFVDSGNLFAKNLQPLCMEQAAAILRKYIPQLKIR